jgi:tetratricopeptide (TPR) repeat protein
MAERLAYLPSLWFCALLAVLLLDHRQSHARHRAGLLIGLLLVLFYGGVCLDRNRDYVSEPVLWMAEVRQNPEDFLGWQNVGEVLTNHRRYVEAEEAYRQMLTLAPDYPGGLRSWTFFLIIQGRFAEALESSTRAYAISERKGEKVAISFDSLNMAESLLELGRYDEAMAALQRAGAILGRVSRYNELLARVLNALERDREAVAAFAKVTVIAPGSDSYQRLAISLLRLGRLDEAREQLKADIGVRGATAETLNLLGVVEAQQGNWPAAVEVFGRAMELDSENLYYQENYERASKALSAGE